MSRSWLVKTQQMIFLVGLIVLTTTVLPNVHAASVTFSPTQLTITQGSTSTSFSIGIQGAPNNGYALTVSGISGEFSPPLVTTDGNGYGYAVFIVDVGAQAYAMNFGPPYCPGTYYFTIQARSNTDSGEATGILTVTSPGQIQIGVSTDKTAYTVGDAITMKISLDRAAHGTITITPPSGNASDYSFVSTSTTPTTITKTFTAAAPYGTWTATVQANDFCGVVTSTSTSFIVNPIMYGVSILLAGVPASTTASVQVDGANQGTVSGTQPSDLSFPNGTSHTISVDEYVSGTAGVRFHCPQNSWSFNSTGTHTFNYQTQYQLSVQTDPEGIFALASGWFDPGTMTRTKPAPQTVDVQTSGVKYVFDYWEVDGVRQSANEVSFIMNGPHTAIAKYTTQYPLLVSSQNDLGSPQGSNYYNAGSVANFSVSTPVGILIQQVFIQWTGDYTGTSPQGSILMDRPHEVQAAWTTSYTQLYALTGTIAVVIAATLILLRRRHNHIIDTETAETRPNRQQASP